MKMYKILLTELKKGNDFTVMFMENQSISLIMKKRPFPPIFFNFIGT